MKNFLMGCFLILSGLASAQAPVPPSAPVALPSKYDTVEHLNTLLTLEKEKNINLQMMLLERQYKDTIADAHQQFNGDEQAVNDWIEKVRKDNGWDASYVYNRDTDTWVHVTPVTPPVTPVAPVPATPIQRPVQPSSPTHIHHPAGLPKTELPKTQLPFPEVGVPSQK